MKQIEVMRTKTRFFATPTFTQKYIADQEANGWAVRQIVVVDSKKEDFRIFVVLEDNR